MAPVVNFCPALSENPLLSVHVQPSSGLDVHMGLLLHVHDKSGNSVQSKDHIRALQYCPARIVLQH